MSDAPLSYRCPEFVRQCMAAIDGDRLWVMCIVMGLANFVLLLCGKLSGAEYGLAQGAIFTALGSAKVIAAKIAPDAKL